MAGEGEGAGAGAGAGGAGAGAGAGGGGGAADPPKTVAKENFDRVVEAKTNLERELTALKAEKQTLLEKASTVDTLAAEVATWKGKTAEAETRFTTHTEFSGALGTTDADVIGLFDQKYRALPEANRPARAAWVATLKEKPAEAPALLAPWLAAPKAAPAGGTGTSPAQPRIPGQPATAAGAPAAATAEQLRAVREKATKTGNWDEYKALREGLGLPKLPGQK